MRNFLIAVIAIICISCSNSTESSEEASTTNIATDFVANTESLEKVEAPNPILAFREAAEEHATKSMGFDKNNINQLLEQAKDYAHLVITVEDHTIVKIEDLADCKSSGSWGACMPKGQGYIKKGDLVEQDDYINNIIGRPDSQKRTAYLFN